MSSNQNLRVLDALLPFPPDIATSNRKGQAPPTPKNFLRRSIERKPAVPINSRFMYCSGSVMFRRAVFFVSFPRPFRVEQYATLLKNLLSWAGLKFLFLCEARRVLHYLQY